MGTFVDFMMGEAVSLRKEIQELKTQLIEARKEIEDLKRKEQALLRLGASVDSSMDRK